jgi:hypothetical protein
MATEIGRWQGETGVFSGRRNAIWKWVADWVKGVADHKKSDVT